MFTLLVCSDVCNTKLNLEIGFATVPTILDIKQRISEVFATEVLELQRQGLLPHDAEIVDAASSQHLLSLDRMQIYDDQVQKWVDLASAQQLHEFDQVYVFPRRRAHLDSRRDLPPPRPPTNRGVGAAPSPITGTTPTVSRAAAATPPPPPLGSTSPFVPPPNRLESPRRPRSPGRARSPTTRPRSPARRARDAAPLVDTVGSGDSRLHTVFAFADRNDVGYVTRNDFGALFRDTHVTFSDVVIDDMFLQHAQSRNYLSFADISDWAHKFPTVFAALYSRIKATEGRSRLQDDLRSVERRLIALRSKEEELRLEMDRVLIDIKADEGLRREIELDLQHRGSTRTHLEEEEQVLLDKEVRVQHQRYMLEKDERELVEAARRFDQHRGVPMATITQSNTTANSDDYETASSTASSTGYRTASRASYRTAPLSRY